MGVVLPIATDPKGNNCSELNTQSATVSLFAILPVEALLAFRAR